MTEKRVLSVNCQCGVTLQVKTRSAEKLVTCPKCGASMMVSAVASAAPEELPFAAIFDESQPLPMAEPLSEMPMAEPLALPFAQPLAGPRRCSPRQLAVAGSIGGGVLVAAVLLLVFRPGARQPDVLNPTASGNNAQTGGSVAEPVTGQQAALAGQPQENGQPDADSSPAVAEQDQSNNVGGNSFDALSKAMIQQGLNNPGNAGGNNFGGGGLQNTPRNQQRDWDLANGGRLGAMGLKKVPVPRR